MLSISTMTLSLSLQPSSSLRLLYWLSGFVPNYFSLHSSNFCPSSSRMLRTMRNTMDLIKGAFQSALWYRKSTPGRRTSFQAGMNKVHCAPWGCIFKHISENRPLQVGVSTLVCWQPSLIRVRSPERVSGQWCPGQHGKNSDSGSHSLCCHYQGNELCFASVFTWDARHFCDLQSPC